MDDAQIGKLVERYLNENLNSELSVNTSGDMLSGAYGRVRSLVRPFAGSRRVGVESEGSLSCGEHSQPVTPCRSVDIIPQEIVSSGLAMDNRISFDELTDIYIKEKTVKSEWKGKTESQNISRLKLLAEIVGEDIDIKTLSRADLIVCLEILKKIPSNRNKLKPYKGKAVTELLAMDISEEALLSTASVKHHMELLSTLFKFAVRHDYLTKNYAEGLSPRITSNASDERQVYDREDLQRIVDYTFRKEREPSRKWIPIIAMHTGMRLEECCQLYKRDIQQTDGVWCVNVTSSDDQKTKTDAGVRKVPIHSKLIELGFLKYVEALTHERLWPELKRGRDGYSDSFGKWYQRLNRGYVTSNRKKVFHSFRHTVVTALVYGDVQDSTIKEIVGHSNVGVTRNRYAKALPATVSQKAIEILDYGLEL
jgi:integrase